MSYEGFREYICENGHYWTVDEGFFYSGGSENEDKKKCPCCKSTPKYRCDVDQTNGWHEEGYEKSWEGPKQEVGFTDEWREDHYGNKYAVKHLRYEPDLTRRRWRVIK